jgi:hypothetical protein
LWYAEEEEKSKRGMSLKRDLKELGIMEARSRSYLSRICSDICCSFAKLGIVLSGAEV